MQFRLQTVFLIIGIIAIPNLFYRGQFDVPVMIFCYACWSDANVAFIVYLLIFSWLMDAYFAFYQLSRPEDQRFYVTEDAGNVLLFISVLVYTLKTVIIIYMLLAEKKCRDCLKADYVSQYFKRLKDISWLKGQKAQQ